MLHFRLSLVASLLTVAASVGPVASRAEPATDTPSALADALDAHLWTHVLAPRFPRCVDRERGGFHETYSRDWTPRDDEGRFVVYQARVTWTAATVALRRPEARQEYLPFVRHGVRYLADALWDDERGGFHTFVSPSGEPLRAGPLTGRMVYGQAFAVYALAAAHAATGDSEPLELAQQAYRWIEEHYRDGQGPGYVSVVQGDGTPFPDPGRAVSGQSVAFGPPDLRTMNDHIHLLEAYADLLRSWPDPGLRRHTEELLAFVRDRIVVEPGCLYYALLPDGRPVPAPVSFGHDVETAFLLLEAEEALGRAPAPATLRVARLLVDHALDAGFDTESGQLFEAGRAWGPPLDRSIEWWGQLEAVNAFHLMHELHGGEDERYEAAFSQAWAFARDRMTDSEHPGFCARVDEHGEAACEVKSHAWFASYHAARALLLTADRLRASPDDRGDAEAGTSGYALLSGPIRGGRSDPRHGWPPRDGSPEVESGN